MDDNGTLEWQYQPLYRLFRLTFRYGEAIYGDFLTPTEGLRKLITILEEALKYAEECDKVMAAMQTPFMGEAIGPALWEAPPVNIVVPPGEEPS